MTESQAARDLEAALADQQRKDQERVERVNAEARAKLDNKQNQRDRAKNSELLQRAAEE